MRQIIEPEIRPLTTDDYIMAAKIVASCPKDRLAVVTSLLISGGFEINYSRRFTGELKIKLDSASVVSQLRDFKEQHDLTWKQMDQKMHMPPDILRSYASGRRIPSQDRCDEILCKLYSLAEEFEKGDQEE